MTNQHIPLGNTEDGTVDALLLWDLPNGLTQKSEWVWLVHQLVLIRKVCALQRAGLGGRPKPRPAPQYTHSLTIPWVLPFLILPIPKGRAAHILWVLSVCTAVFPPLLSFLPSCPQHTCLGKVILCP